MQRRGAFIYYAMGRAGGGRGTEEEVEQGGRRAQRFALCPPKSHISHFLENHCYIICHAETISLEM